MKPDKSLAGKTVRRAGFAARHPAAFRTIRSVQRQGITFLEFEALAEIYSTVRQIERKKVPGVLLEAGCAAGGSAVIIAKAKATARAFFAYDVFGLIPPPTDKDGQDVHERYGEITSGQAVGPGGKLYYGYERDLLEVVKRNFRKNGVEPAQHDVTFVKGLYEETLEINEPVAFAHIDCDWYDSVMTCLERIVPCLQPQGEIVIDDYFAWSGCKDAVDDYFRERMDEFSLVSRSRLHVIRGSAQ